MGCTCQHALQAEAMETEMAEELQREREARSAALEEGGEGDEAVQEAGPALVLAEADGKGDSAGQRCTSSHPVMPSASILLRMQSLMPCTSGVLNCCKGPGSLQLHPLHYDDALGRLLMSWHPVLETELGHTIIKQQSLCEVTWVWCAGRAS